MTRHHADSLFRPFAVGCGMLADPAWARKVHEGREAELVPYDEEALDTLY